MWVKTHNIWFQVMFVFGPRVSVVKTQVKKLRGDNAHHIVEAGGCGSRHGRNIRHFPVFHGIEFNFGARIHWS
jgi:hypothetical protein